MSKSRKRIRETLAPPATLRTVKVVLVQPKHPSNVGAIVRACENFECFDLEVVQPRCDVRDDEVWRVACGSAIVDSITVHTTLQDALAGVAAAVALTRRGGTTRQVASSWSDLMHTSPAVRDAVCSCSSERPQVALVFGREESGLTEEELRVCSHLCGIPTGRTQGSMNLSHAAAVVLAQAFEMALAHAGGPPGPQAEGRQQQLASRAEVEALLVKMQEAAGNAGLSTSYTTGGSSHGRRYSALGHIRAFIDRSAVRVPEVRAFHTLFKAIISGEKR